ncbi:type VI secretion system protein TssA [Vibrio rotiferianus]|uniref:type VI secretion system protein TssA n=1 Tax=Vibrio rotiferianus TaxID=190895 RepID=UPI00406A1A3B
MISNSHLFDWYESALKPIEGSSATGTDPREDVSPQSTYYRLKDQRMLARNEERNAIIEEESILLHSGLWRVFLEEVPDVLSNQAKDLEFVAWLIEALTRLHGFRGLGVGYELATELVGTYWDGIYPMPDEDGIETRISPLIGLNGIESEGTLIFPIASIPLTEMGVDQAFAYWEYQQAIDLERLDEDKRRYKIDGGAVELGKILDTVKTTSDEFYNSLIADLEYAKTSFDKFTEVLDSAVGDVTPSSYISQKLESILSALKHVLGGRYPTQKQAKEVVDDKPEQDCILEENNSQLEPTELLATNMRSREQAITQLQSVADFFRETEPHSPVSYTIEQVIRWCGMPLPDLLAELISDGDAKNSYFRLVGIANQNNEG